MYLILERHLCTSSRVWYKNSIHLVNSSILQVPTLYSPKTHLPYIAKYLRYQLPKTSHGPEIFILAAVRIQPLFGWNYRFPLVSLAHHGYRVEYDNHKSVFLENDGKGTASCGRRMTSTPNIPSIGRTRSHFSSL